MLTVYEVGSDGDRDYIAMELVDGTTLDAWLGVGPPQAEVVAAIPIGFTNESSFEGPVEGLVPMYTPGDLHAVIDDNAPGEVTLCATSGDDTSTALSCVPAKLPPRGAFATVLSPKQR